MLVLPADKMTATTSGLCFVESRGICWLRNRICLMQ